MSSSIIRRLAKPSIKALTNLLSFSSANSKIVPYEALLISDSISPFLVFFLSLTVFIYDLNESLFFYLKKWVI